MYTVYANTDSEAIHYTHAFIMFLHALPNTMIVVVFVGIQRGTLH